MAAHTFSLSAWESEAGGSPDLRPAWPTKRNTVSKQNKPRKQNNNKQTNQQTKTPNQKLKLKPKEDGQVWWCTSVILELLWSGEEITGAQQPASLTTLATPRLARDPVSKSQVGPVR